MVKFEVIIPDDEWDKQVKENKEVRAALEDADIDVDKLLDEGNAAIFNEACGYINLSNMHEHISIDFREIWKIKEI